MTRFTEHWLIDRNGRHWHRSDTRLADALGTTLSGVELAQFAVTNLGFVELRYAGKRLNIRCRPARVTGAAFGSLGYFLFDFGWRPIALSLLTNSWIDRIFPRREDALEALTRLIPTPLSVEEDRHGRLLRAGVLEADSPLAIQARSCIADLALGNLEPETFAKLDRVFRGRWSISHVDTESDRFEFDHVGSGFTSFEPAWSGGQGFRPVTNASDNGYMVWIQKSRRTVTSLEHPVFEMVDAWAETPGGLARLRYHRVNMPMRALGPRRYVLSASVDDCAIDLRKAV